MPCRFASSGTVATSRSASRAILALNAASNFLRDLVISVLHRLRQSRTLHTLTFGPISGVHFKGHKNYDGDGLERALGSAVSETILKMRSRRARQRQILQLSNDSETKRGISEEGRLIRQEVSRTKNRPEFVRAALRSELDQFVEGFAFSVSSLIDARVNTQILRLAGSAREALNKSGPHAVDDARRSF